MIGSGREEGGLYYLHLDVASPNPSIACQSSVSAQRWHSRLGHPSLRSSKLLVPGLGSVSELHCESCELGKHKRVSFLPRVDTRASAPFRLVHSDIFCPIRVPNQCGYQYFVIFIDDYSRMTWLYFMKARSEVVN